MGTDILKYFVLAVGLLTSVVGVINLSRGIVQWVLERRGFLAGPWTQRIPAFDGQPYKEDRIICKHRGEKVKATITRILPAEERDRQWRFSGAFKGRTLFGYFEGSVNRRAELRDNRDNRQSFGVIFMMQADRRHFTGDYIRLRGSLDQRHPGEPLSGVVRRPSTPLDWER